MVEYFVGLSLFFQVKKNNKTDEKHRLHLQKIIRPPFSKLLKRTISLHKVHLWMEISADCPNRGRRSLTKMDRPGNVQSNVWTVQQVLSDKLHVHPIYHNFSPKSPRGQSLCTKSTSGWKFLQAVPIAADAV